MSDRRRQIAVAGTLGALDLLAGLILGPVLGWV